jgi:membrane associated rhomboid family serine protease
MQLLLTKTLLSKKTTPQSTFVGLLSYFILLLVFIADNQNLSANGYLVYEKGEYWKAFTTSLMHGDFVHLGHNTLFFLAFSVLLNSYFGFWIFPVLSFIVGGAINLIALKIYEPHIYLVGISGVIYFMAAFWMTMFVALERHMSLYKRMMITTGVSLILFFPELFTKNNVSYLAHGLGFGMGIISALIYYRFNRKTLRGHEVWIEKTPDLEEEHFDEDFSLKDPDHKSN